MSRAIILELAVGSDLSAPEAADVVAAARDAGVSAIRLLDGGAGQVLDPNTVASYLAARLADVHWIVDAPTTHNAPYNLARRTLALDRATGGRSGLVLRAGEGDEVSAATVPDPSASGRSQRWAEYAEVLTRLWESFPAAALLGDQAAGLLAEDSLIRGIAHEGSFYRVSGPLDGPSSPQGRPVLAAADMDQLDWASVAGAADVVVVNRAQAPAAQGALADALGRTGRKRAEIALVGRVAVTAAEASADNVAAELDEWVTSMGLDGLELRPPDGRAGALTVAHNVLPRLQSSAGASLRAALGLPELTGART
jgi:alkanesulfonate monooxygenase SsuD/methylene tetrahydromethanopterin reductase-like flavin-dependent oxidoreductase (luciferase family)